MSPIIADGSFSNNQLEPTIATAMIRQDKALLKSLLLTKVLANLIL